MRTFILALLTAITLSACGQCNVKQGNYTSSGGSEQNTILTLSSDKSFIVINEAWQPGHYEKRETSQLNGTWTCNNEHITLKAHDKNYRAELIVVGENPLGLKADSKALLFEDNKNNFLHREMLYPEF